MSEVPDEAVTAAVQAAVSLYPDGHLEAGPLDRDVRAILRAAEPFIAAAERERIRQVAVEHAATYDETSPCSCGRTMPDGSGCTVLVRSGVPFADLLGDPQ